MPSRPRQRHGAVSWGPLVPLVAVALAVGAPAACLYPTYTFDLPGPDAGTGGAGGVATTTTGSGSASGGKAGSGGGHSSTHATTTTASSGSTTSTSSTGGAAGGGGAGGAGGNPGCLDGTLACDDPKCSKGYQCVEAPPTGWADLGLVELYIGIPGTQPACPADEPNDGYDGNDSVIQTAAQCSACGCDPPAGQACTAFDLDPVAPGDQAMQVADVPCAMNVANMLSTVTVQKICNGACQTSPVAGGQMCPGGACNQAARSSPPTVTGGACLAQGGTATLPQVQWNLAALACSGASLSSSKGCSANQVCAPRPPSPFVAQVCISKAGDNTCPASSTYAKPHVFYGSATDGRACSGCACGSPNGGSCTVSMELFSDVACSTPVATFDDGQCATLAGNPAIGSNQCSVTTPPHGGSCTPDPLGGAPTGQLTPSQPTTFCCVQ